MDCAQGQVSVEPKGNRMKNFFTAPCAPHEMEGIKDDGNAQYKAGIYHCVLEII